MAKSTKKPGIRVNQLAHELEVDSKDILAKFKSEGLDWAANHQSTISLGQAETVREWVASGEIAKHAGGGVAVATEGDEGAAPAKKAPPRRKKKSEEAAPAAPAEEPAPAAEAAPVAPVAPEAEVVAPPAPPAPAPVVEAAPVTPTPTPAPPAAPEAPPAAAATAAPAAPVTPPPAAKPVAPAAPHVHEPRPTITLANRPSIHVPERKPITPAPQLTTLAKPVMQGPKVIRVEKADVLPPLRGPRRPPGAGTGDQPAFTQARPTTGRGVKIAEDDEESEKKKAASKGRTLSARRRGPDGRRGEAMEKLKEYTEADLIERRDRLNAAAASRASFDSHLKKSSERGTHAQAKTAVQRGGALEIEEPITVKSLSAALGIKSNDIIKKLMQQGVFANINQGLDVETAQMLAMDYGLELRIAQQATMEEELVAEFANREVDESKLQIRPPVVTILGHVDHGKTSLLDKIRNANVAAGEAGGITQHTAAWMVEVEGGDKQRKRVTFIDTPGHQAFTSMRARGANMTDVVVLVVSAAEGVQPQTIESINHAKAAGVPIVVAMNKIDRPDANDAKVLGELSGQGGLNPVEWGGDVEVIRTSATTGQGIKELIEILDLQSQLLELKADPSGPARGVVIESRVDEGLGAVATVLVQDGTLKVGDIILAGPSYGRVRSLLNDNGKQITDAGPSQPVIVSGLAELPGAGEKFFVVEDADRARAIAEERAMQARQMQLAGQNRVTAANLIETMTAGDVQTINLIIKADVQGSLETLVATVGQQNTEEVKVRVIHSGVGAVTESDVTLAMATKNKPTDNRVAIIGFHVVPEDAARVLAEQNHIDVKTYRVIYEIFDDLKKALSGMLAPEEREKLHGHAEIRQVFKFSKVGSIAGCFVTDGHIQRGSKIRLIRDGKIITENLAIETLKRVKDDVKEVKNGMECGIKLAGYDDIKQGDRLEAYVKETFERTL